MVELGRIDIPMRSLPSPSTLPTLVWDTLRLPYILHVMGYLKQKHNTRLVFDPTYPTIDIDSFSKYYWTEFYGKVEEAIPSDILTPLGKDLDVCMMCDSDHAGEKRTRRSHTGSLIFCNMALIDWVSKKQAA
jgi:hypothetical protein